MKKLFLGALVCLACGSDDRTEVTLPEPGRPYTLEEVYPEAEARPSTAELVDVIEWRSERLEFWNTGTNAEPTILVTMLGPITQGEISSLLEDQTGTPVTAAEIWREVTGRQDVPEVLARAHRASAEALGRPAAYQDFAPLVRDKATFSFNAMFTIPASNPGRCWEAQTLRVLAGPSRGISTSTVCSSQTPRTTTFLRSQPVSLATTCPKNLEVNVPAIKAGVFSESSASALTARVCYDGGSSAPWTCLNSVSLSEGQYYVQSYPACGSLCSKKRFGIGVDTGISASLIYGAGVMKTGVPTFGTTSCDTIGLNP